MNKHRKSPRKKQQSNSAEYLENIIALMPGHVYWKDRNGILQGCNDEQARDVGLKSRHEVKGLTAYDTLPKELADKITQVDAEVINKGKEKTVEEILKLPNGKKSIWLSKKVPLQNRVGNIIGLLGISLDITEYRRTRKRLEETKYKLKGITTAVSANLAHELRTPLAALNLSTNNIKQYLPQLIAGYELAKQAGLIVEPIKKDRLKLLNSSIEAMELEIRSALTFIDMLLVNLKSKVSMKNDELFLMAECIYEALKRYPFEGTESSLVNFNAQADFQIKGRKIFMIHAFFNLIKNSLYSIAAAGKGCIDIWLGETKGYHKVYFKDTGLGISSDILPKIFKRFFTKKIHGAGIGLTFAKMVMQSIGGKINCKSVEGEYTLFTLSFPKN